MIIQPSSLISVDGGKKIEIKETKRKKIRWYVNRNKNESVCMGEEEKVETEIDLLMLLACTHIYTHELKIFISIEL